MQVPPSEEAPGGITLAYLRASIIPMRDMDQWDHGELARAVLNLENQTVLAACSVLLRLAVVERRSLDETKESRAVALREVLLELLPKELDHPYCSALRALAGLEPGTTGRNRERRQQMAGVALGTDRHPATTRTVRRRVKEDCWPWLLDRLIEWEVAERRRTRTREAIESPDRRGSVDQREVSSQPTRREVLAYLGTALVAAGLDQATRAARGTRLPRVLQALEVTREPSAPTPDAAVVESLAGVVEHYKLVFRGAPPAELYDEILEVRRYAGSLLEGAPASSSSSDVVVAVGWLSNLLALVTHDLGDPAAALVWCADAERRSAEAGLPELAGWAAQTRVLMSFYDGKAEEAIGHAQRGQELAPLGTVAHAKLVVQEMRARALLGEAQAGMVPSTRRRAEKAIAKLPHDAPKRGAFSIAPSEDPPLTATSLLLVGRLQEAEAATRRVIAAFCGSASEKGKTADPSGFARIYLILGLALAGLGKPDEAHAAASVALGAPRFVRPTAVLAGKLDEALTRDFGGTPEARDYHERYVSAVQTQHLFPLPARGEAHDPASGTW